MKRLKRGLILVIASLALMSDPALAVTPNGTYNSFDQPASHYNRDSFIFSGTDIPQSQAAWYFSHQFGFDGGVPDTGGYAGLQIDPGARKSNILAVERCGRQLFKCPRSDLSAF